MYNPKITDAPFDGTLSIKRGHKQIFDIHGAALGTVSNKCVRDLNGEVVGEFERKEKVLNSEGKKKSCRVYKSSKYGSFKLAVTDFFMDGELVGRVPKKERNPAHIIMLSLASILLCLTLAFIILIDLPYSDVPKINVVDNDGSWEGRGVIAVLDDSISPGSSGEYDFVVNNPHNKMMKYDFVIKEYYNDAQVSDFPLQFRLRMNNALITTERWLSADELKYYEMLFMPDSSHRYTLEWRWLYEGESDDVDTYFGRDGGKYKLVFELVAEIYEES